MNLQSIFRSANTDKLSTTLRAVVVTLTSIGGLNGKKL